MTLRLTRSVSSVGSLFFSFLVGSRTEPTRQLLSRDQLCSTSRILRLVACIIVRCLQCLCETRFTLLIFRAGHMRNPPLITLDSHQLALQRNCTLYPPVDVGLELVSRFEDHHRGHRQRESRI